MLDRAAVLTALAEYAKKPATSRDTRAEPGEVFSAAPFPLLRQFVQSVRSPEELNAFLADVAALLRDGDPFRVSVLALNCGTLVERGGDPAVVAPHLLAALPRHLMLAVRAADATFDTDPDAVRAHAGLTFLMLAAMAVLCRGAKFRQAARANPEIVAGVEAMRELHSESDYVARVLSFTDDLNLVVLAPNELKGFRFACEAVATYAHLFTLLQAALIGAGHLAGEAPDPELVAVATGESPHTQLLQDHARFHFYTINGGPGDALGALMEMPVDGTPAGIPRLDGVPVLLVGPTVLGFRGWDSNFFANIHDALRSRAEIVEVLPEAEVKRWVDRIARR